MKGALLAARLRRLAVLRAEAELSRRRAAEADAARAEVQADEAIAREIAAGCAQPGADALAAWLAAAHEGREQARARRADAVLAVDQVRARVASAEIAREAVESLIRRQTRAARLREMRAGQVALDDWAGHGGRGARDGPAVQRAGAAKACVGFQTDGTPRSR